MAEGNNTQISSLQRFLNVVDRQITTNNLNLLRLSLYASEGVMWRSLECCNTPSKMFRLLASHDGEQVALQKFLFALMAIGRKAHGTYCAIKEAGRLLQGSLPTPSYPEFHSQSKKFRYFHWLVMIARMLPDWSGVNIRRHFARVINESYHKFDVPQLFIKLYQAKIISEDDSSLLIAELQKCREPFRTNSTDAKILTKCLSLLSDFHSTDPTEPFTEG